MVYNHAGTHMNPTLPHLDHPEELPLVVLASASPRRRAMLEELGIDHAIHPASVDDGDLMPGDVDPEHWVAALAYLKASSSLAAYENANSSNPQIQSRETVVIGADTVCVHQGKIVGQPDDRNHAKTMILSMADATHEVLTGVAIVDPLTGRRELFVDRSVVRVGDVSTQEIEHYLDSQLWMGKAGAYNITERLAAGWPIEFEGDETSIVGLPMTRTLERVSRFFVD
jgi:septum formation protein